MGERDEVTGVALVYRGLPPKLCLQGQLGIH